jgi:hypothetical protein
LARQSLAQDGVRNGEAIELGLREALLKDGRPLLQNLYAQMELAVPNNASKPGEKCHHDRPLQMHSILGPVQLRRDYFYCPATGQGRFPLDEALGLVESFSPALVRLGARAVAREGYQAASEDLAALAGIQIEGRQLHRLVQQVGPRIAAQLEQGIAEEREPIPVMYIEADATGVPMVTEELAGRPGKQPDGSSKTREIKLGCVFTQTKPDPDTGLPMRDFDSTTYLGSFETASDFGIRLRQEALRRGLARALKIVFLGDGAAWIWELARVNFPMAILIVDFYHVAERLHELCQDLYSGLGHWAERREEEWKQMLKEDRVAEVIAAARRRWQDLGGAADDWLDKQITYFENHQSRMLYKTYRDQGLFYGSGVIEAGCKAVIGQRLKESGMFWTETGASQVLALRCALKGNRWDECWDRLHDSHYLKIRVAA